MMKLSLVAVLAAAIGAGATAAIISAQAQPVSSREFFPTDGALYVIDRTAGLIHLCHPLGAEVVCDRATEIP